MKLSPTVKACVMCTQIYFSVGLTERNCFYINSYNKGFKKERGWTSNGKKYGILDKAHLNIKHATGTRQSDSTGASAESQSRACILLSPT